ncbi:MAG: V-type ATP synthase subunit A [Omnitrophica WOR_2 bacterium RIFOXYB2_FULL_38_16]|nr:MAG: V-type ATP synthase subunit A [Omnitrophica WOR_2 bacterium RIFOXYA2_FULL_38_17]OGX54541.1 MAG: V-type ATP synthase subunit A [Omnitrophica WOR_2 bacterium RIFOXYA12_FULL_38_10]OGX54964.1 MAG: V-type ATP synthase subunit A [Omnitrophica WOR_2 bacterium RIFOXYC2_FULL_38_12]OGX59526.1 MAG: V-type ATP synthase subunit A [Omnitrophica WOR_2 bacterium RIFOXYB2_FULL_38_16]HBG62064.1 V-type ATP synthase subunit A [Candidatus Omnitrophota bacterium]
MVAVEFEDNVMQNEVAYINVGDEKLKAEVIRVKGKRTDLQVFEDTVGIKVGDIAEFTGELLSVELGPGLLGKVYDGLQNPLNRLAEKYGFFLKRGAYLDALEEGEEWEFTPTVKIGDKLFAGEKVGTVPEKIFEHRIMVPFKLQGQWEIVEISPKGKYTVDKVVAKIKNEEGRTSDVTMLQKWPVKVPIEAYSKKLKPVDPLVTKIRIIDTLVPVAIGGTFCTPGPFGAGKTVLQHLLSRHAEVDIVIVAACGERAGEVVEILEEFPELIDPKTGKSLMERTIIICNTSSMPVAARESSVYTGATLAEYYRQMGLNVFLLADSTSRWAQAMREMSGRLEEIPGEEAFPAYLESRIASFYERAGLVKLRDGSKGSLTIGGAVSPAGGNFEEPVTQATLKVVGAFHGLSRDRANARKYPSIDPLDSWSKYTSFIESDKVANAVAILRKSQSVGQMMKVVGEEGISNEEFVEFLKGEFFDAVYLQQNAFDKIDEATTSDRQKYMFAIMDEIIEKKFKFTSKDIARRFFQELRQSFITFNTLEFDSDEFKKRESEIRKKLSDA